MIRFNSDYIEGCHPNILVTLAAMHFAQNATYGTDSHCRYAADLITGACDAPDAAVHFLVGGTQTNTIVIAAALRPWQGVLCPETGHINCHETGAIEATGHKVLPLPQKEGKITARQIREAVAQHRADAAHEHIVQPGMVYISQPTEFGTLYTASELTEIYLACRDCGLKLYIDGARMSCALAADETLDLADYARLSDAFSIGGTKAGLLFGEALVIRDAELQRDFRYLIKQRGGMLAKGWLLGLQYETMFIDGLYYEVGRHAVEEARRIRAALLEKGIPLLLDSPTNQLFPLLTKAQYQKLSHDFVLEPWGERVGEREAVRICTSWATARENTEALIEAIRNL